MCVCNINMKCDPLSTFHQPVKSLHFVFCAPTVSMCTNVARCTLQMKRNVKINAILRNENSKLISQIFNFLFEAYDMLDFFYLSAVFRQQQFIQTNLVKINQQYLFLQFFNKMLYIGFKTVNQLSQFDVLFYHVQVFLTVSVIVKNYVMSVS